MPISRLECNCCLGLIGKEFDSCLEITLRYEPKYSWWSRRESGIRLIQTKMQMRTDSISRATSKLGNLASSPPAELFPQNSVNIISMSVLFLEYQHLITRWVAAVTGLLLFTLSLVLGDYFPRSLCSSLLKILLPFFFFFWYKKQYFEYRKAQ